MKRLEPQSGFTLVELTIVLAITSVALAFVFAGQSNQRNRTQYSVDVDSLLNQVKEVQNEAQNSVAYSNGVSSGPSGSSIYTFWGKEIVFNGTNSMDVTTLVLPDGSGVCPSGTTGRDICRVDRRTYSFGSTVVNNTGSCQAIVFEYKNSGEPASIYTPPCAATLASITNHSNAETINLGQVVNNGQAASINVDPANVSITRTIN